MKRLLLITFLLLQTLTYAQKTCEFKTNVTDSIGTYKEIKEKMIVEKNFGNTASYVFLGLSNIYGTPVLNFQLIQKSKDFIKANCFDSSSKIYLQLENGKIITLWIGEEGSCGSMLHDETQSSNIRLTTTSFLFMKNTIEELKKSPVSIARVKYSNETVDYILKKELVSELTKETYNPESFFIDYLKCID